MPRSPYIAATVERDLRDYIHSSLAPGMQLPSERDLADQLGASRPTVREVVSMMCRSGELVRKWGIGTFVASPVRPFVLNLSTSVVLRRDAIDQGFDASFTPAVVDQLGASSDLAELWGIDAGAPLWRIDRVLRLDGHPAMRVCDLVPHVLNGRNTSFDGFGGPGAADFIPFVHEQTGLYMSESDTTLRSTVADEESARLLEIETGAPVLASDYIGRAADGRVINVSHVWYVQGRVEVRVNARWSGWSSTDPPTSATATNDTPGTNPPTQ